MCNRALVIWILALLLFGAMTAGAYSASVYKNTTAKKSSDLRQVVEINEARYTIHNVIRINNNSDFAEQAATEGWPGKGTENNPYVISGYDINARGDGDAIYIGNTTVYFVVKNCYLHNASYYPYSSYPYFEGDGITLYNVTNGDIENNTVSSNDYDGISLQASSNNNSILDNICINNEGDGISLDTSRNNSLLNNTCSNNLDEGIALFLSGNNTISNNTCNHQSRYGIFIEDSSNDVISDNTCGYNKYGGIDMDHAPYGNILSNNICTDNSYVGIYIGDSKNSTIFNNTCAHNGYYGIDMEFSRSNVLSNNTFIHNGNGIYISSSHENTILNNLFVNDWGYGIYIISGSYNSIYNNTFFYNHGSGDYYDLSHIQAYDDGENNYWNTTSGIGNYWHAWSNNNNTNDKNHDGIVDWSYKIAGSADSRDNYPLKHTSVRLPPLAPINLTAIVGNGYVNLTWNAPRGNGTSPVTSYHVYRNGSLLITLRVNQLHYNDTSVINGITYTYYITAVNSAGESNKSDVVHAKPLGPPTAPPNLRAKSGSNFINLTWEIPNSDGGCQITEYKVYRNGTPIATVPANRLYYQDTGVKNGQKYTYYVTAVNCVGESKESNKVQVIPAAANLKMQMDSMLLMGGLLIGLISFVSVLYLILRKREKK